MNTRARLAKWVGGIALGLAALGLLADAGSEDADGGLGAVASTQADASGSGRTYSFTEVDGNGNSRMFSHGPGSTPRESVANYLSSSVVYP